MPLAWDPEKVSKKSGDSPKSLSQILSGDSPETIQTDFLGTCWGPMARSSARHFQDFFGILGPEGPRDPCKGQADSQSPRENPQQKNHHPHKRLKHMSCEGSPRCFPRNVIRTRMAKQCSW